MTTPKIYTMVILAILTFSSQVTKAEIANGSYSFDSNGTAALWDISGDYSNDDGNGLNMDFSVSEDSSGNLKGTGTFAYDDGDNYLDGNITLTGYVKGSATAKLNADNPLRLSVKVLNV